MKGETRTLNKITVTTDDESLGAVGPVVESIRDERGAVDLNFVTGSEF